MADAHFLHRAVLGLTLGGLLVAGPLAVPAAAAAVDVADCGVPTPAALAGYFDGVVPDALSDNNVPGAAVSVVSGGQTVFAQGYGLSDVEHQTPFSATDSLVRIASITKLFTWTAVMQQVQAGRLDLDTDVNQYLTTFKIPTPVTLRMLMSHTAGFEDKVIGTAARSAADVAPLGDFLAANVPEQIYPPGQVSAYSNYGAALAGYLVSVVSGEPYDAYVQHHLLDPLGMRHTTATEPVPPGLAGGQAHSYNSDSTPPRLVPFEFDRLTPDGSISASAADMARFMTAHLDETGAGILSPATMAQMHERDFAADPRLGGYAHGFQDRVINGHRVLMHDGSWEGFLSALITMPDCDLGFFITTNATGGVEAATRVMDGFFDQFAPTTAPSGPAPSTWDSGLAVTTPRAGFYEPARHNESGLEKLLVLLGSARLGVDPDGTVHFRNRTWTAKGDGLYEAADGSDRLVFLTDAGGQRYLATNGPMFRLLPSDQTLPVNLVVLLLFAIPAITGPAVPLVALGRRIRRRPTTTPKAWRWARGLAAGAAGLGLFYLVALLLTLAFDASDFIYGAPARFILLQALPIIALAAAVTAAGLTVRGWRRSAQGVTARVHQVTLLVGLTALAWFCWQWNLIGWPV